MASILVASGSFEQILSYFMVVTIAFLALMVTVVYVRADGTEQGRVPGYPFTPIGFLVPVVLVILLATASSPVQTGVGPGIVLLGLPAYALFVRGDHSPTVG